MTFFLIINRSYYHRKFTKSTQVGIRSLKLLLFPHLSIITEVRPLSKRQKNKFTKVSKV